MYAQKNVTHMFVCADAALSIAEAPTTARHLGKKLVGRLACEAGALSAGNEFQLLYRDVNGTLQTSPALEWSNLLSKAKTTHSAATNQKVVIGYNGTSGSIAVSNSDEYLINVGYRDQLAQFGNKTFYKYAQYASTTSATQYLIANGLHTTFVANTKKDNLFYMEKLNSGTSLATSGGALTVTNGSTIITTVESAGAAADAGKYNADAATIVAGDILRIGHATTKTNGVYKVVSITGGGTDDAIIVIDQPYVGPSGSVAAANAGVIPIASEGDYGLRIVANDAAKTIVPGLFFYSPIRFDVGLSDAFGSTITTVEAVAFEGAGTFNLVRQVEYELLGNRREAYRIAEYPLAPPALGATSGETYTLYNLRFKDNSTETITGTADSFIEVMVASAGGTLTAALDTLFGF